MNRELQLVGCHDAYISRLARTVTLGRHTIELVDYSNGNEELVLNGTVIASWNQEEGLGDYRISEQFHELTGLYPYEWDIEYRRSCWSEYRGVTWYFAEVRPVTKSPENRRG